MHMFQISPTQWIYNHRGRAHNLALQISNYDKEFLFFFFINRPVKHNIALILKLYKTIFIFKYSYP